MFLLIYSILYLIPEVPVSQGILLNQYLENGDISLLKIVFSNPSVNYNASEENFTMWQKLYEYNKTLASDKKIKVIGLDLEHSSRIALEVMKSFIPNSTPPVEIKSQIDELNKLVNNKITDKSIIKNFTDKLNKDMVSKKHIYESYLGDNYFYFQLINYNVLKRIEWNKYIEINNGQINQVKYAEFDKYRDSIIYENFKKIYNTVPKGKYFGQWGSEHVFQRQYDGKKYFASLLNQEDSPVKNRVISTIYIYKNCKRMPTQMTNNNVGTIINQNQILFKLEKFNKTNLTLFKLIGDKSPFQKSLSLMFDSTGMGIISSKGSTTDYYQFIIVPKDFKEAIPLESK